MAREAARLLDQSAGQFIVVLKRGVHFPYARDFPPDRAFWQPAGDVYGESAADHDALVNNYDNALRYNLDPFFEALLGSAGTPARTVVLYTSDHGAHLSGAGAHPMMRGLEWETTAVPLLMFGDRPAVDVGYRASHHNLFATLLELMRVPAEVRPAAYSRSLLSARASDHDERIVLAGVLTEAGGFQVGDFDRFVRPDIAPPHEARLP
jgi:glucan phosphoethanolaminetransferase (alkaline phosphatase superfamily)